MLLKIFVYKKKDLIIVIEISILEEVLKILEIFGYCCVLILDFLGNIFCGNIYKMYIYCYKVNGGDMMFFVIYFLKNVIKFIYLDIFFFKVFFMIKEFFYIVVFDSENYFYGILIYSILFNMFF